MKLNATPIYDNDYVHCSNGATIEPWEPTFIWSERIPAEAVSLMYGDSGIGKTKLCCKIAADVSIGHTSVSGINNIQIEPAKVVYISVDTTAEIIAHYIQENGGDLTNISILNMNELNIPSHALLENDFNMLCTIIALTKPRLLIIDNWRAFINKPTANAIRDYKMREILHDLASLCDRTQCGALLTMHPNKVKKAKSDMWHWTQDVEELYNGCRSVIQLVHDIDDTTNNIMIHLKANYSPYCKSLKFSISNNRIDWCGESDIDGRAITCTWEWGMSVAEATKWVREHCKRRETKEESES